MTVSRYRRSAACPEPSSIGLVADIIAGHGDSPVGLTAGADVLAWADRMRARLVDRPVPPDLGAQLLERFDRIAGTDGVVAVRACAVAAADGRGEDGGTDPFAGLSDSFLNVRRDELLSRVAACWASGYSDRAVRYRMRRGVSPLSVSIAVGVQEMVPAERSFVAFNPGPRRRQRPLRDRGGARLTAKGWSRRRPILTTSTWTWPRGRWTAARRSPAVRC